MVQTNTLIVGSSIAGLACAGALSRQGVEYVIIEKEAQIALPWRNHYERLHLHTNKSLSSLPYKKFDKNIPRYASRLQVIEYLENYKTVFNINPGFNTEATLITKDNESWIIETNNGTYKSKYLVIATGQYSKPKKISIKGMENFTGAILHSNKYKTGRSFKGQKVLVIGFGNSACEIALDLYEQGAAPSMSVRSGVNIIPRDLLGIPILKISFLMSRLPVRLADAINNLLMKLLFGNLKKLGLKKKQYGTFEQIQKDGTIPLIDIGTIKEIRKGNIKIFEEINYIDGKTVYFSNRKSEYFDAIIAAIGYEPSYSSIMKLEKEQIVDLRKRSSRQNFFGKNGLYFCGFYTSPTGVIHEIASEAKKIAKDIFGRLKNSVTKI